MGRGQVVRQWVLVPLLGGSNPSVPDCLYQKQKILLFNNFLFNVGYNVIQSFVFDSRNNLENYIFSFIRKPMFHIHEMWILTRYVRNRNVKEKALYSFPQRKSKENKGRIPIPHKMWKLKNTWFLILISSFVLKLLKPRKNK